MLRKRSTKFWLRLGEWDGGCPLSFFCRWPNLVIVGDSDDVLEAALQGLWSRLMKMITNRERSVRDGRDLGSRFVQVWVDDYDLDQR